MTPFDMEPEGQPSGGESRTPLDFLFRGTAGEYFGIWIVNLLLTIVTLGIWSAWAKVRRLRFFYGNTRLAGSAFEYHATGKQLLIGRLLVGAALLIYIVSPYIHPILQPFLALAFLAAFPWIMNRSLRFNARMTSWRNVRFDFTGTYGEAFVAYILMPLVGVLSLGLLLPRTHRYTARYVINSLQFGTAQFDTDPPLKPFYMVALQALGLLLIVAVIPFGIGAVLFMDFIEVAMQTEQGNRDAPPTGDAAGMILAIQAVAGLAFLGFFAVATYYRAKVRNIILSHAVLDGKHELRCRLSGFRMAWIVVSNLLATILSLGLLFPWCQVRLWRYQCNHLHATPGGSLDEFVDDQAQAGDAFASEFADLQSFDVGI